MFFLREAIFYRGGLNPLFLMTNNSVIPMDDFRQQGEGASNCDAAAESSADMFQGLEAKIPPMPANIDPVASRHWMFIGERLVQNKLLTEVDLGQFRILCETYALYVHAQRDVEEKGEFQKTPNGYAQLAPWAVARERHANRYQKISDKFFLSPRARKAVKFDNPTQGELDLNG